MVISHPTSSSARKSKPDELEKKVVTFHELALPIFIRNWFTMTRNVILARWVKKRIVKYSEHKIVRKLFWRYHLLYNYRVGQKKTSKIWNAAISNLFIRLSSFFQQMILIILGSFGEKMK